MPYRFLRRLAAVAADLVFALAPGVLLACFVAWLIYHLR